MNNSSALIQVQQLSQAIESKNGNLLIIDLCSDDNYNTGHIPGAVHIRPSQLSCGLKPAPGKLPDLHVLQTLLQNIGLTHNKKVITYDDAGGSWAGRMIWTLALIGYNNTVMLNGGLNTVIRQIKF